MDLRQYLAIAKRQKWIIIEAVFVVAIIAGVLSALETPQYQSAARVAYQPNDPTEALYTSFVYYDPDRYLTLQTDIIRSEPVLEAAAEESGIDAAQLAGMISVGQQADADILTITATGLDPARVADAANAVASAYVANREAAARGDLQRVADELGQRLVDLQAEIAAYDAQIGDGGLAPGATPTIIAPEAPATDGPTAPDNPAPTAPAIPAPTGPATTDEGLKAARYAAAVQYQSIYARQQDILVQLSLKKGAATLLTDAGVPGAPIGSGAVRDGVLGGIVGLMLGLGVAFVREQLDDRARSREELEAITGLPVLAELPLDARAQKDRGFIAAVQDPVSSLAEATRSLRTSIGFLGIDTPIRQVVVTSPSPGDGKTVVSANLAATYAQAGFLTVLVSADLRRPTLGAMFGYEEAKLPGLAELVATAGPYRVGGGVKVDRRDGSTVRTTVAAANGSSSHLSFDDVLLATGIENLWLLPSGHLPPNPAELLASHRAEEVLDALLAEADVIVIDSPPVLAVTDGVVLASRSDGVVLVAAASDTRRGALKRAVETLSAPGIRILGAVYNKTEPRNGQYGYGYYGYAPTAPSKPKRWSRKAEPEEQPVEVSS